MSMREFNAKLGKLEFSFEWRLTLLTLVLIPLLVTLGFWQLERAQEKRALAERHAARMLEPPLAMADIMAGSAADTNEQLADRRVTFIAKALPGDYLLLDNRIRNGRVGYDVIALLDASGYRVPVNLGWVPGDPTRRSLPVIELPTYPIDWYGRLYQPLGAAYLLAEQAPLVELPTVIQAYEPVEYAKQLTGLFSVPVAPFTVRINPRHPEAFQADWPIVNQSHEKHTGYAFQWFTMAAVLLLVFLLRSSNAGAVLRGRTSR